MRGIRNDRFVYCDYRGGGDFEGEEIMGMEGYSAFIESKTHSGANSGFKPLFVPDDLFDFQKALTEWAIEKGRGSLFCDCGLGKTIMQLVWAENVARHTNKPVLILTPLAVSAQTEREGEKFGIECKRSNDGNIHGKIVITNYEKLCHFDSTKFSGLVCDESSILKSFDGSRKSEITNFMRKLPYRLLATATAAPNDYIELGTSSEALGYMGYMDMLNKFFKNDLNNSSTRRMYGEAPKWRFKGHAEIPFWRYVTSWARACRKPSDMGFDDGKFKLPKLTENMHIVDALSLPEGMLFNLPATDLREQREERKRTITERCETVVKLTESHKQSLIWCHLNNEGDLLEKIIPDAVQVSGHEKDEAKEEKFLAFADGKIKNLITKPKIGAWGLNFQNCAHETYFPSHSYEQYYQSVRRCWRFGQKNPVTIDIVATEGERRVFENLNRKALAAEKMFSNLVTEMNHSVEMSKANIYTNKEEVPQWL